MKLNLFKVKEGKLQQWKEWGNLLMTKYKEEAIETLKEEEVLFEASASFELNGETYVLGMTEGEGLPANMNRELNKKHIEMRKECLDYLTKIEMNYELYNK